MASSPPRASRPCATRCRSAKELRELIRMGNVLQAVELVERLYPGLLQRRPYIHFRLRCQQFIELLRKGEAMEAVSYAQGELAPITRAAASEEAIEARSQTSSRSSRTRARARRPVGCPRG